MPAWVPAVSDHTELKLLPVRIGTNGLPVTGLSSSDSSSTTWWPALQRDDRTRVSLRLQWGFSMWIAAAGHDSPAARRAALEGQVDAALQLPAVVDEVAVLAALVCPVDHARRRPREDCHRPRRPVCQREHEGLRLAVGQTVI